MFENKEGTKIPDITFKTREGDEWKEVSSEQIFSGKNVIVFSLPGAFTPTCSSTHLPRYNQLSSAFKANGVDEIVCLSVNDAFVMNAWKNDQEAENILVLPDGNGEFTEKMGMLVDKSELGFGKRSWRYSMYVEDGVVKKMFIEPLKDGDPFEVSDADTMLEYLAPDSKARKAVSVLTKPGCSYCAKAKEMLTDSGYDFEEIVLGENVSSKALLALSGKQTVPQVFFEGELIGGSEELEEFLKR